MTAPLKVAEEIECQVFKSPPCLISGQAKLACKLATHAHGYGSEDMLNASPDCGLDVIQLFRCVTPWMIARDFFHGSGIRSLPYIKIPRSIRLNMPNLPNHNHIRSRDPTS
jgi:hypothetical protein